jgi:hypothetical protein
MRVDSVAVRRIFSPLALILAAVAATTALAGPAATAAITTGPGTQLWVSRYGAPANDNNAYSVAVSPNGDTVYITGTSYSGASYGKSASGWDYRTGSGWPVTTGRATAAITRMR